MVKHAGRTQQRVAGPSAELGDTIQVCWCTDMPPAEGETTTRILNLVTCPLCVHLINRRRVDANHSYAGIDDDGIYLHPAEWNIDRLSGLEETLLAHFFKLVYMERVRQIKRWGDQRHPDGTGEGYAELAAYLKTRCQDNAARGKVTWLDILMEEVGEIAECDPITEAGLLQLSGGEGDLEAEMVQSAAVIAAWYSDICRRELTPGAEFSVVAGKTISQAPMITRESLERDISLHDGAASAYGLGLPGAQPDGRGETLDRKGTMASTQWGITGQQGVERLRDAIRELQGEHGGQLPEGEYTIDLRGESNETPE